MNINSTYLSSDAVALFMHAADNNNAYGDANAALSLTELCNYINQTLGAGQPDTRHVTPAEIEPIFRNTQGWNVNNLAHFYVYYIQYWYLQKCNHQCVHVVLVVLQY